MARPYLPNEIMLMIAQYLTSRGIASLMQCNRELYTLLQGDLIYNRTPGANRNGVILWACQHGREDVVRAMLYRQGEFEWRAWKGFELVSPNPYSDLHLPLRFAAFYGHVGIMRILLDWDINLIQRDIRSLRAAVNRRNLEAVKVLLEYSTKMSEDEPVSREEVEEEEEEEYVVDLDDEEFLEESPLQPSPLEPEHENENEAPAHRPNENKISNRRHAGFVNHALFEAVRSGYEEIVEVLLAEGAEISLALAASIGSERFVKLGCHRERPNIVHPSNLSPLEEASKGGHEGALQILLGAGWDVNLRHTLGRTPLYTAAVYSQEAIVRMLLDRTDVLPDVADNRGETPLLEASRNGHLGIIQRLLKTGNVDVNAKSSSGKSALSFVAQRGVEEAVRLFLSTGAHPDIPDDLGRTPLSLASEAGFPEVVRLLLAVEGVNPDSKCRNNQTPLAYAVLSGRFPGRVKGSKVNSNDDQDERDMLGILQGSVEERLACLSVETDGEEDDAALLIMKMLLVNDRVDPNARDSKGRSVLCLAILRAELAAVKLLLASSKSDVEGKVYRDFTPVDLVKEKYRMKRVSEQRNNRNGA